MVTVWACEHKWVIGYLGCLTSRMSWSSFILISNKFKEAEMTGSLRIGTCKLQIKFIETSHLYFSGEMLLCGKIFSATVGMAWWIFYQKSLSKTL